MPFTPVYPLSPVFVELADVSAAASWDEARDEAAVRMRMAALPGRSRASLVSEKESGAYAEPNAFEL